MNTETTVFPQSKTQSRSLHWKCGDIVMGKENEPSEGRLADWSRRGLDCSTAYEQVQLIVNSTINALNAIRNMVAYTRETASELLIAKDTHNIAASVSQLDALLEQITAIVADASLGEINLLGKCSGCLNIPYLLTEIKDLDSFHSFATMGISISPIHEDIPVFGELLVGLYVLSTDENDSVCWLGSPSFWMKMRQPDPDPVLERRALQNEVSSFIRKLDRFERLLTQQREQFELYIKMVGELITDPIMES